ncbi:MAG: hypothetical protein WAK95_17770 [Desulfobacterales bacterium]
MTSYSPFLDVRSFAEEEELGGAMELPTRTQPGSPFLAVYEFEEEGRVDPQTEEYVAFLNELFDEQFNEALSNLVDEAAGIYETNFSNELQDLHTAGYRAERLLTQHFAPLVAEAESMVRTLATELGRRDLNTLSEEEIETIIDGYHPSTEINPQFEEWIGGFLKKVAKKGLNLAKNAASTAAKLGLGPILNNVRTLFNPIINRVVKSAIHRLPPYLQPMARLLRDKLPFLKEFAESDGSEPETAPTYEVTEIQNEFNQQVANILFAQTEAEQELEVAHAVNPPAGPDVYPTAELELARERFIDGLGQLRQGEDPTPQVENFLPALIPALKLGFRLTGGRGKVLDYLAKFLGKVIQKFVDPQYAPPLSKAIVDAGLRLLQLETTPEGESRAAASAVTSTLEETVRRVAALPDYVLDNQELFEGAALEAFEQAAAGNLPPVLSEDTYRKRPELRDRRRGFMYRCGRRYKKRLGPKIMVRISPYKVASLETFDGNTVGEALEEQYAIAPGEELEAQVHLYEAMPGMRLSDIVRGEEVIAKVDGENGYSQLHPLTREAAALLLDQPELGRDGEGETGDPNAPQVGQRFYYLEIPGKRPLTVPMPEGRAHVRHRSRTRIVFHFPKNEIIARLYLSEIRAQEIAVKLRQHGHMGVVMERLRRFVDRGVNRAFSANRGRLKIIHGTVVPGQPVDALKRLPTLVLQVFRGRLTEWLVKGLADHIQKHAQEFIRAADEAADGVTMVITLENPPGFPRLCEALKGKGISLASLKLPAGDPTVKLRIYPGHKHG